MSRFLDILVKVFGIVILLTIGFIALHLFGFQMHLNSQTRQKISAVMNDQYPSYKIFIEDSDDFPINQRCYQISMTSRTTGKKLRKFVAVNGDNDGGTWSFIREHGSMQSCIMQYSRG